MHSQGFYGQLCNICEPVGNDAAMTLRVIAFEAHQAGATGAHQFSRNVDVAQGRVSFHVPAEDCLKLPVIAGARRLAASSGIAETAQVNVFDAGDSQSLSQLIFWRTPSSLIRASRARQSARQSRPVEEQRRSHRSSIPRSRWLQWCNSWLTSPSL